MHLSKLNEIEANDLFVYFITNTHIHDTMVFKSESSSDACVSRSLLTRKNNHEMHQHSDRSDYIRCWSERKINIFLSIRFLSWHIQGTHIFVITYIEYIYSLRQIEQIQKRSHSQEESSRQQIDRNSKWSKNWDWAVQMKGEREKEMNRVRLESNGEAIIATYHVE